MQRDFAQICANGHVINCFATLKPDDNQPFCDRCGGKAISACHQCNRKIQGAYINEVVIEFDPPAYCYSCGSAFPWTISKKQAAIELYALEVRDEALRKEFENHIDEITKDTPKAQVSASRLSKMISKLSENAQKILTSLLTNLATEVAKTFIK